MRVGSLLPLTITINLIISMTNFVRKETMSGLTASECPHPGAVEHVYTISVPLNQATLVLTGNKAIHLVYTLGHSK